MIDCPARHRWDCFTENLTLQLCSCARLQRARRNGDEYRRAAYADEAFWFYSILIH